MKKMMYFDDLDPTKKMLVNKRLQTDKLKNIVMFKNANGKELTCLPIQTSEEQFLVILDRKSLYARPQKTSFRFVPDNYVFDID